jgi:hypothetical protein
VREIQLDAQIPALMDNAEWEAEALEGIKPRENLQ